MRRPAADKPGPRGHENRNRPWLIAVLAGFVLSRLLYLALGIRFDSSPLSWFWQYVDPVLLKSDFGTSLLYLHSQPPLMNLFLGLVVNLFPGTENAAFTVVYLLQGVGLAVGLYLLMVELGVSPRLSAIITLVYAAGPDCVLYESWLFYSYPVATALVLAALFCIRFLKRSRSGDALGLFAALGVVALTWSLFHLVWFVLCLTFLLLTRRRLWRRITLAALIPLLCILFWYAKNLVLFGRFTASTWSGMNFSKMTNSMVTPEERRELRSKGLISPVSLVPPFSAIDLYESHLSLPQPRAIPVLDQRLKPSGVPNYNHQAYIETSDRYGSDALEVLKARPQAYLRGLAHSYLTFFIPAGAYYFLLENRARVNALARAYSVLFHGRFFFKLDHGLIRTNPARYYLEELKNVGFWLLAGYLLAFGCGVWLVRKGRWKSGPTYLGLTFIWLNLVYATIVGNGVEVGENNRFRFVLDPLLIAMLAAVGRVAFANRGQPKKVN